VTHEQEIRKKTIAHMHKFVLQVSDTLAKDLLKTCTCEQISFLYVSVSFLFLILTQTCRHRYV